MRLVRTVVTGIGLFSLLYVGIIILAQENSKNETRLSNLASKIGLKNKSSGMFFKQKSWDGIPISYSNYLYIKIDNDSFNDAYELEQTLKSMEHPNLPELELLLKKYLPKVGFNGIMTSMNEGN